MFSADTSRPTEEILADVRNAAFTQMQAPGLAFAPFAVLLVHLSEKASATADKNLLIQKRVIWITIMVFFI